MSTSLPTSSPLESAGQGLVSLRANSEMGHYADMDHGIIRNTHDQSASVDEERSREARDDRKSFHSGLYAVSMPLPRGKRIENTAQRRHGCPVPCAM